MLFLLVFALVFALAFSAIVAVATMAACVSSVRATRAARTERAKVPLWISLEACRLHDLGAWRDHPAVVLRPSRMAVLWHLIAGHMAEVPAALRRARIALRWAVACSPVLRAIRRPMRHAAPVAAVVALSLALAACGVAPLADSRVGATVRAISGGRIAAMIRGAR